jgi:hypothetical protein
VTGSNIADIAEGQLGAGPCGWSPYDGYLATGTHQTNSCADPGNPNDGESQEWCADFAGWVWQQAGISDLSTAETYSGNYDLDNGSASFYDYGEKHGTVSMTPAVGDAVVYNFGTNGNAQNWASHVAIVVAVHADGTVDTVAGNSGDSVGADDDEPATGTTSWGDQISGYIAPVYPNLPGPAAPSVHISTPGAGALVGGKITISAPVSDSTAGVAFSTQFFVDGHASGSPVPGTSPSITWDSTATNGAHALTATTTASNTGGHASTTSAAVTVNVRNRFQVAFNAAGTGALYLYGNGTGAINGGTPVGLAPNTSPAIAELAGGGFEVAFAAAGTGELYLYGTGPGSVNGGTPVGLAPNTSPAIAALPSGGFQVVFHAGGTGQLWRYGVGAGSYTGSTPVGLADGTSPSIATLSTGGYEVAFTAAGNDELYLYGNGPGAVNGGTPVGAAAGTSPAITALPGGGFQVVFSGAGTGALWRYGVGAGSYNGSTPVGLAANTSPAVN